MKIPKYPSGKKKAKLKSERKSPVKLPNLNQPIYKKHPGNGIKIRKTLYQQEKQRMCGFCGHYHVPGEPHLIRQPHNLPPQKKISLRNQVKLAPLAPKQSINISHSISNSTNNDILGGRNFSMNNRLKANNQEAKAFS